MLKRLARSNSTFQLEDRKVSTITKTVSGFTVDSDTGCYRCKLWGSESSPTTEYPDLGTLTCTVQASGSSGTVWQPAIDKYSFIAGREEYAPDIYQDQMEEDGTELEDAMYIVFNTPPFSLSNSVSFTFGTINPKVKFEYMHPIVDNYANFKNSLFSYEQWLCPDSCIRTLPTPNRFLIAFPGVLQDFTLTESGLIRQSKESYWTTPPPYSPKVQEYDVLVRAHTGQRFQITDLTPIYIENILVSQHFTLSEYSPKSSIYEIEVV